MTKKQFINLLKDNYVNLDYVSSRVIDYKYYEYLLFQILIKYPYEDLKLLGLPDSLEIKICPDINDYHFRKRTHVTLNYQLYKLYDCCYFKTEIELVDATLKIVSYYKNKIATIKQLDNELRKLRIKFLQQ